MYSETWHKIHCPECDTINWVNDGDLSDMSAIDVEGCECRQCGYIWVFNADMKLEVRYAIYGEEDLTIKDLLEKEYFNIAKGRETPL